MRLNTALDDVRSEIVLLRRLETGQPPPLPLRSPAPNPASDHPLDLQDAVDQPLHLTLDQKRADGGLQQSHGPQTPSEAVVLDNLRMTFDEEAIPDEIPTAHTLDAHGCVFAQGLFPLVKGILAHPLISVSCQTHPGPGLQLRHTCHSVGLLQDRIGRVELGKSPHLLFVPHFPQFVLPQKPCRHQSAGSPVDLYAPLGPHHPHRQLDLEGSLVMAMGLVLPVQHPRLRGVDFW
mmetsp:Transcript_89629/g.149039  ORF Transcript_89629/g.149039 Transcript_89629/m.149039 type:complete len:234 (-) Transcript_89629:1281-1982(-)